MTTTALLLSPAVLHASALGSLVPVAVYSTLQRDRSTPDRGRFFFPLALFAALSLSAWIGWRLAQGWAFGFGAALDVSAAATFTAFAIVSLFWREARGLAPLALLYCGPMLLIAQFFRDFAPANGPVGPKDAWFWAHILLSGPAFGVIGVAALSGLAVLLRQHMLKKRRSNRWIDGFPALVPAEKLQFRLLWAAFLLLIGAASTGVATAYIETGVLTALDHKSILTIVGTIFVAGMLIMHSRFGLHGRAAVRLALTVFLIFQLAYPGVKFVTSVLVPS